VLVYINRIQTLLKMLTQYIYGRLCCWFFASWQSPLYRTVNLLQVVTIHIYILFVIYLFIYLFIYLLNYLLFSQEFCLIGWFIRYMFLYNRKKKYLTKKYKKKIKKSRLRWCFVSHQQQIKTKNNRTITIFLVFK
jgi:hypothetical protein